jgi:hypothetical protein
MMKNKELFFFFGISDATTFKQKLKSDILPLVTTTTQLLDMSTQPATALLNIAFSHAGLQALNVSLGDDTVGDPNVFGKGQLANVANLGDPGTTNWVQQFVGTSIHGCMLISSDTEYNINTALNNLKTKLGNSISEIYSLQGAARPDAEKGHERG